MEGLGFTIVEACTVVLLPQDVGEEVNVGIETVRRWHNRNVNLPEYRWDLLVLIQPPSYDSTLSVNHSLQTGALLPQTHGTYEIGEHNGRAQLQNSYVVLQPSFEEVGMDVNLRNVALLLVLADVPQVVPTQEQSQTFRAQNRIRRFVDDAVGSR